MALYDDLGELARTYGLVFRAGENAASLTEPASGRVIDIYSEEYDTHTEYIVGFSTQHRHIEEPEEAADFVREILLDEALPIEFYLNGARRFGGDLTREEAAALTVTALAARFMLPADVLKTYDYEITSWSGRFDTGRSPVSALPD